MGDQTTQSDGQPQAGQPVKIPFDLNVVLEEFLRRLDRIVKRSSLCLGAVNQFPDMPAVGPLVNAQFQFHVLDQPTSSPETREEASAWIAGVGLREGHDTLNELAEDVWKMLLAADRITSGNAKLLGANVVGDWNPRTIATLAGIENTNTFDRAGIEDKLNQFEKRFGFKLPWSDELVSLNRARNCLTHRSGVVGPKDVDSTGSLVIRFRSIKLLIREPNGSAGPIERGRVYAGGSSLELGVGLPEARLFKVGEHLRLTPQDFMHLVMTYQLAGQQLIEQAHSAIRAMLRRLPSLP